MRYLTIDTVSYEDIYGKKVAVKDMREYPGYTTARVMNINAEDRIDEIATRKDVFGEDAENEIYKIVEHNIEDLFESRFDSAKLKSLKIPVR